MEIEDSTKLRSFNHLRQAPTNCPDIFIFLFCLISRQRFHSWPGPADSRLPNRSSALLKHPHSSYSYIFGRPLLFIWIWFWRKTDDAKQTMQGVWIMLGIKWWGHLVNKCKINGCPGKVRDSEWLDFSVR